MSDEARQDFPLQYQMKNFIAPVWKFFSLRFTKYVPTLIYSALLTETQECITASWWNNWHRGTTYPEELHKKSPTTKKVLELVIEIRR